ncbi:uncharacterized protein LOC118430178 [Branchiostoma floridae]|uniref:Uncharacterized protein LOC118430178 n=1 Tax=Branchiostoma floridae TaxID=7739 RepID=A0A9J7M9I7_BRAFL|nr:uncharacterized protein LOC118430178 [Branchiostoma floridae]
MAVSKCTYRFLGCSGLKVSNLCLGAMTFGEHRGGRPGQCDEATAHAIMDKFAELGGNFIDTADVYQYGVAEEYVGSWLSMKQRDRFIIATKVNFNMDPTQQDPNKRGLSRHHILNSIDGSLRRLQTDYVDLYQVGREQQREKFVIATKVCGPMGQDPNQLGLSRHHIMASIDKSLKRLQTDYVDLYQAGRNAVTAASGCLSPPAGKSVAQVSLRWLLQKDVVSSVIIGVKTLQQLEDNMGAADGWELTQQQMDDLDAASAVEIPYPYEMVWRANKAAGRQRP